METLIHFFFTLFFQVDLPVCNENFLKVNLDIKGIVSTPLLPRQDLSGHQWAGSPSVNLKFDINQETCVCVGV